MAGTSEFVAASFNVHAGVDGWGRPFDWLGECRALDADVLVLQEAWQPDEGPGMAAVVAQDLGYTRFELPLARGRVALPDPAADARWMRSLDWRSVNHSIYLDSERPLSRSVTRSPRFASAPAGSWNVAVLTRLPVARSEVIDLGRLWRDRVRRGALVVWVEVAGREVAIVGTHMTHITYGSPLHYRRLARDLDRVVGDAPALLAGDMNLWGPPVGLLLPGWQRTVKGNTWPAWRPHSQVDHIVVRGLAVTGGQVRPDAGSDHRPITARVGLP
jgi:endonuclease/exonuclease/phosphatase family metal-dependent hydrolase